MSRWKESSEVAVVLTNTEGYYKQISIERHRFGRSEVIGKSNAKRKEWTIPIQDGDDSDDIRKWNYKQLMTSGYYLDEEFPIETIFAANSNDLFPIYLDGDLGLIDRFCYLVSNCLYSVLYSIANTEIPGKLFKRNKPIPVLRLDIPGLLFKDGSFSPTYERAIPSLNPFNEYYAKRLNYKISNNRFPKTETVIKDKQYAVCSDYEIIVPFGKYSTISGFDRGLAIATKDTGEHYLINYDGKVVHYRINGKLYDTLYRLDDIESFYGDGEKSEITLKYKDKEYHIPIFSIVEYAYYEIIHEDEIWRERYEAYLSEEEAREYDIETGNYPSDPGEPNDFDNDPSLEAVDGEVSALCNLD